MAEYAHIARPYVQAAFEFAEDNDQLAKWSVFLTDVAKCVQYQQIEDLVENPEIEQKDIVDVLSALLKDEIDQYMFNFLSVIAKNKRLLLLKYIGEYFNELKDAAENKVNATITSADKLNQEYVNKIKAKLAKRFDSEIKIKALINKNLIGGAVIEVGDLVIDGSIKGKLQRLDQTLLA